jgi:hypothetical protein
LCLQIPSGWEIVLGMCVGEKRSLTVPVLMPGLVMRYDVELLGAEDDPELGAIVKQMDRDGDGHVTGEEAGEHFRQQVSVVSGPLIIWHIGVQSRRGITVGCDVAYGAVVEFCG